MCICIWVCVYLENWKRSNQIHVHGHRIFNCSSMIFIQWSSYKLKCIKTHKNNKKARRWWGQQRNHKLQIAKQMNWKRLENLKYTFTHRKNEAKIIECWFKGKTRREKYRSIVCLRWMIRLGLDAQPWIFFTKTRVRQNTLKIIKQHTHTNKSKTKRKSIKNLSSVDPPWFCCASIWIFFFTPLLTLFSHEFRPSRLQKVFVLVWAVNKLHAFST